VAAANITEKPFGCLVDPPDDPRRIDDVARDTNVVQSLLDVAVGCRAAGHHKKCA
jgi:hypothetical protein